MLLEEKKQQALHDSDHKSQNASQQLDIFQFPAGDIQYDPLHLIQFKAVDPLFHHITDIDFPDRGFYHIFHGMIHEIRYLTVQGTLQLAQNSLPDATRNNRRNLFINDRQDLNPYGPDQLLLVFALDQPADKFLYGVIKARNS